MAHDSLSHRLVLPELDVTKTRSLRRGRLEMFARKRTAFEVCPKCAACSSAVYDRRTLRVKDEPIRRRVTWLVIEKRRFWCKPCRKPFTEPVHGIKKGARTGAANELWNLGKDPLRSDKNPKSGLKW